jgi:hypothetical protein
VAMPPAVVVCLQQPSNNLCANALLQSLHAQLPTQLARRLSCPLSPPSPTCLNAPDVLLMLPEPLPRPEASLYRNQEVKAT